MAINDASSSQDLVFSVNGTDRLRVDDNGVVRMQLVVGSTVADASSSSGGTLYANNQRAESGAMMLVGSKTRHPHYHTELGSSWEIWGGRNPEAGQRARFRLHL